MSEGHSSSRDHAIHAQSPNAPATGKVRRVVYAAVPWLVPASIWIVGIALVDRLSPQIYATSVHRWIGGLVVTAVVTLFFPVWPRRHWNARKQRWEGGLADLTHAYGHGDHSQQRSMIVAIPWQWWAFWATALTVLAVMWTGRGFCNTHRCVTSFANDRGSNDMCYDGMWSHMARRPEPCSGHGGLNP